MAGRVAGSSGRRRPRFELRHIVVFLAVAVDAVAANWWMLGMPTTHTTLLPPPGSPLPPDAPGLGSGLLIVGGGLGTNGYRDKCRRLPFLGDRQREMCGLSENVLTTIGMGARLGIEECQHQFRMSRWNCSTFVNTSSVFGGVLSIKSRETAYVYAISSAGVAFAVTRACSRGELNECSCDEKVRQRKARRNWQWGGCSEDIHFGERFSKDFVDSRENPETAEGLMNLHNNEAGRRSIRSQMQRVCKCHGMSGSCTVRVCWRRLPLFRHVGDVLAARFEGASHVRMVERRPRPQLTQQQRAGGGGAHGRRGHARKAAQARGGGLSQQPTGAIEYREEAIRPRIKKLRAMGRDMKQPNRTDLVFLEESPDYCERNDTLGILGTRGRLCNRTSLGLDGCRLLCCGRGYQTRVRDVTEKCRCRFVWCCNVVCDVCRYQKEEHLCN
ncbi:protein Wnt-1-like [Ischnura elegans]|uniref:protein Wnt-1-like n=1 Tax=Ischnura elegans TaxID=197161 RepID=UPI001ED888E7|nr:protein Wnt-1-like [Ischnura elegans]